MTSTRRSFLGVASALGGLQVASLATGPASYATSARRHTAAREPSAAQVRAATAASTADNTNIRNFGAVGDGVTDDTAAIDSARAAGTSLYFPPGDYVYAGAGLSADRLTLRGAGRGSTSIRLAPGKSLVTCTTGFITSLFVDGLIVSGGYGAIRCTSTSESVHDSLVVQNCWFHDYTGAAISSLSVDQPYWRISNNTFWAANQGPATFGVSLNGDNAQTVIENNSFVNDGCHVKLMGTGGQASKVYKNDFIRFGPFETVPRIDIWVGNSANSGALGAGLVIQGNKFGPELSDSRDFRILVAKADTGSSTDAALLRPNLSTASAFTFQNALIADNLWDGTAVNGACSFFTTACPDLRAVQISNLMAGGTVGSPIVDFLFSPGESEQATTNVLGPILGGDLFVNGDWSSFSLVSHPGYFTIVDATKRVQDPDAAIIYPGSGDLTSFTLLSNTPAGAWSKVSGATASPLSDSVGGADAATVSFPSANSCLYNPFSVSAYKPAVPIIFEFDAKRSLASPAPCMTVRFLTDGLSHWRRNVKLTGGAGWRRYRFEYVPPLGATVNQASFQLSAPGNCDIGRIRIYQGREPVNVDGQFPLGVIAKAARLTGVRTISSNYTAVATDATVLASGGASGLKLTLPSAAVGQRLEVKKVDSAAGHITVAPASGTIDGAATYTLAARNAAITCVCDGKLWYII